MAGPGDASLEGLCAAVGIAPAFDDIRGRRIEAPRESLVALLAAFGLRAGTAEEIAAAKAKLSAAARREALPPVAVIGAGAPRWSIPLRPQGPPRRLHWTIVEENGARHAGAADAAAELEIRLALPAGYHRLGVEGLPGETLLLCAPARCYRPPALAEDARIWGPALQLYALRSERNWGIGDFGDLARLVECAAGMGASIIGLNPLHALFAHNPAHASPYSPSSRLQLNALYLDIEAIGEFGECEAARRRVRSAEFQARLARLREATLVDYPNVAAAKAEVLELLYAHFRECHLGKPGPRGRAFEEFRGAGGRPLRLHAIYEALQAKLHAADGSVWGWPAWPEEFRDCDSPEVARFAAEQHERVEYHEYLQWQAALQLEQASERCRALGLAVGLYLDLAVSVDRAGSDAWTQQDCFALAASVGAPPDEFNPNGQDWGLPPLRPDRLRAGGYRFFIDTLRRNMRHAGALRIDHVMGLMRLYWIPQGGQLPGSYVHYALEEMLAIVALESERNRCMVIGEDLGTVADEMRAAMSRYGLLSYRLLYFERGAGGEFRSSAEYPREALVAIGTHDLATLAGWWTGRAQERVRLLLALQRAGLLPAGVAVETASAQELTPALVEAVHAFVAAAPSRVMMVQLEDAIGVAEQANMPGTTEEHPNWRRKLPETLEALAAGERLRKLAAVLAARRARRRA